MGDELNAFYLSYYQRLEGCSSTHMYILPYLDDNSNPQINKQIREINFSHLKKIYCDRNKIETIEGITRLQMPVLEELTLGKDEYI